MVELTEQTLTFIDGSVKVKQIISNNEEKIIIIDIGYAKRRGTGEEVWSGSRNDFAVFLERLSAISCGLKAAILKDGFK